MATKIGFPIGFFLVVALVGSMQIASQEHLDDALIKTLFGARLNDAGSTYDLDEIRWERGSFTATKALEALVAFYDGNQCHACGWSETWLLRFEGQWKVDRKLEEADWVSFEVVDIEQDGISEIWIESGGGNQGYFSSEDRLLSLDHSASSILYSSSGFDYFGGGAEGEAVRAHEIEFRDLGKDGTLEILDVETSRFYQWTGEKWGSDYVEIAATSQLRVLKLEGGSFQEMALPDPSTPPH